MVTASFQQISRRAWFAAREKARDKDSLWVRVRLRVRLRFVGWGAALARVRVILVRANRKFFVLGTVNVFRVNVRTVEA